MSTLADYAAYKIAERFLASLMSAKLRPHLVVPKHAQPRKNTFSTDRVRSFLQALGNPQQHVRCVHITGTSGKTSTAWLTAALMESQGFSTGLLTSPHLQTFAEHFIINRQLPRLADVLALVQRVKPVICQGYAAKQWGLMSYSECMLAMALMYFVERETDVVVLETFLGGRRDATNVIDRAAVSVITSIGLDHTHILGNSLHAIASEKIGILKPGCPCITAEQRPELLALFQQHAERQETSIQALGREFRIEGVQAGADGTMFDYVSERRTYRRLHVAACGAYQARNAALAVRALEITAEAAGCSIREQGVRHALRELRIPGRFEVMQTDPMVILDVAHNPDKIGELIGYVQHRLPGEQIVCVCAFATGGNPEAMLRTLLAVSRSIYLPREIIGFREHEDPRYLKQIVATINPDARAVLAADPFDALEQAISEAAAQHRSVCVTGSAYIVGYMRQRWYPEHELLH